MAKVMSKLVGFFVFLILTTKSQAVTRHLSSCAAIDIQNAIDSAAIDDVIKLPLCTVTWHSTITVPNTKGITLDGNGSTVTRGNLDTKDALIYISPHASAHTRITGFKFIDSKVAYGYFITVAEGNESTAKFRIDNNSFNGMDIGTHILIGAPVYGVIDHNTFIWEGNNEIIHNEAYGAESSAGWNNDVIPGSGEALFIEDNVFKNQVSGNPAYFWGGSAVQGYYGSRTVFRYNSLSMAQVDMHGTPGMIGARWWEVYENTFNMIENGNQDKYIVMRGGSGVIFNNHKIGFPNLGSGGIVVLEEDNGYPALYQVGRGKNQALDPAYIWGNDSSMEVWSDSANVTLNCDYYLYSRPGYTPYQYPHPLVSAKASPSSPAPTTTMPTNQTVEPAPVVPTTPTSTLGSVQQPVRPQIPKDRRIFKRDKIKRKTLFKKR